MPHVKAQDMLLKRLQNREKENNAWDAGVVMENKFWVCSLMGAQNVEELRKHEITHILTPAAMLKIFTKKNPQPEDLKHLKLKQFKIIDHPAASVLEILPEALAFLDEAFSDPNSKVVVNCASGVSRSVSVCIAYLMTREGYNYDDALNHIRETRSKANPNIGFKVQLQALETCNLDIEAAKVLYKEKLGKEDIQCILYGQREAANEFHAEVDGLEIDICGNSNATAEETEIFIEKLKTLKIKIEAQKADTRLDDRVAKTILKSAFTKTDRLLSEEEEKLNPTTTNSSGEAVDIDIEGEN